MHSGVLLSAYSAFRAEEYSAFFDATDATGLPRAVREDARNKQSDYLAYKSVAAPCTRMCNAFVTADDENHALALIVPTVSL